MTPPRLPTSLSAPKAKNGTGATPRSSAATPCRPPSTGAALSHRLPPCHLPRDTPPLDIPVAPLHKNGVATPACTPTPLLRRTPPSGASQVRSRALLGRHAQASP